MTRLALAAVLLFATAAHAETPQSKFGPDCGQGAVWDSIVHQCTTILPQNDPYRDITIGQPGMTTIRCEHDPERIEITPGSEVRIFCKGVAP